MAIAPTLRKYLEDHHVKYDLIPHEPTVSSLGTASACHIGDDRLAKGIVLRDPQGYWLAVLPASRQIRLSDLKAELGARAELATEQEVAEVFPDCARGAIPPVGACYGLDVIVDGSVDEQPEVYFEGGDHATLVHVSQADFAQLNRYARHGSFTSRDER
jgi:Ala-tRNA(Pro) deacylase